LAGGPRTFSRTTFFRGFGGGAERRLEGGTEKAVFFAFGRGISFAVGGNLLPPASRSVGNHRAGAGPGRSFFVAGSGAASGGGFRFHGRFLRAIFSRLVLRTVRPGFSHPDPGDPRAGRENPAESEPKGGDFCPTGAARGGFRFNQFTPRRYFARGEFPAVFFDFWGPPRFLRFAPRKKGPLGPPLRSTEEGESGGPMQGCRRQLKQGLFPQGRCFGVPPGGLRFERNFRSFGGSTITGRLGRPGAPSVHGGGRQVYRGGGGPLPFSWTISFPEPPGGGGFEGEEGIGGPQPCGPAERARFQVGGRQEFGLFHHFRKFRSVRSKEGSPRILLTHFDGRRGIWGGR